VIFSKFFDFVPHASKSSNSFCSSVKLSVRFTDLPVKTFDIDFFYSAAESSDAEDMSRFCVAGCAAKLCETNFLVNDIIAVLEQYVKSSSPRGILRV
jgi:hypothetical protein